MSQKLIMVQWRLRKLSHEQCVEDLVLSRDPGSIRLIEVVRAVQRMENEQAEREEREERLCRLETQLGAFRGHPKIDEFIMQYRAAKEAAPRWRFKFLLLRGRTRMGKSQKAMSLFGIKHTLIVNCQGLESALPSLRLVSEDTRCIVFDEISAKQVLANKMVFQAGPWPVTLGQSACGQHAYSLNLYAMPMVCCSNDFQTTTAHGLSEDAAAWLEENMFEASPPAGCAWYWSSPSAAHVAVLPSAHGM